MIINRILAVNGVLDFNNGHGVKGGDFVLSDYMTELEKIELLSLEEEKCLWAAYRLHDDESARMTLIEHYQPLVFKEAYTYRHVVSDVMDCVQEGTIGLIEAVERFDYERGIAFSLYAVHRIRGRILDFLRKEGRGGILLQDVTEEGAWWEELPDQTPSIENVVEEKAYSSIVTGALKKLPMQEKRVMEEVYLENKSIAYIAHELNCSNSYIHRLRRQGLKRMKNLLRAVNETWSE